MGNETLYETFMSMAYLPFGGFCKAGEFGYIHTIQPELVVPTRKIIGCSMNTYPIHMWHDVTLEFRDRHSVSSLRYRNRAKITILMCEQRSPVWYGFRAGVLA